jgi:predicted homoserine dehydrogenase-like protein
MIIVDTALQKRAFERNPIRVGMIGAGFMARGIALQVATAVPGMRIAAIAARRIDQAARAYAEAGENAPAECRTQQSLEAAIDAGHPAVTDDPLLVAGAAGIDAVLEVTGSVETGAAVAVKAIRHRKHLILMNAELDGTLGPLLKQKADKAGIVYTNADGDQPGVMMNLARFVRGIGVRPVLIGNIKGLHDPYRNPTTQEGFARRWGQKPSMVTSFADGTKISFEQAIVANATGMRVAKRGMHGPVVPAGTPIDRAAEFFPARDLIEGPGIVDYVVGATPGPGVFVLGTIDHPVQKHYLNLYKLGEGPFYCFYTPYHLCHFEVPTTVARAVLFQDAAVAPLGAPCVEVIAAAKRDLQANEVIDGLGEYMTYGLAENAATARRENLLPIGLAEGCRLVRDVAKDEVITYRDVMAPVDRLCHELRAEQDLAFAPPKAA